MGRPPSFTQDQKEFVYALALATGRTFKTLEPIVRALAQAQSLAWLGPNANVSFASWSHRTAERWAKENGWDLKAIETPDQPLPPEEDIDEELLRKRLKVVEVFYGRIVNGEGDQNQNQIAFYRASEQVENQITRRMTRPLTPRTIAELVYRVLNRMQGVKDPSEQDMYQAVLTEIQRVKLIPPAQGAES